MKMPEDKICKAELIIRLFLSCRGSIAPVRALGKVVGSQAHIGG